MSDITLAKTKLMETRENGVSTYSILQKVIRDILDTRPSDPSKKLGQIVDKVCLTLDLESNNSTETSSTSYESEIAELQKELFSGSGIEELGEDDEGEANPLPDVQQLSYLFEKGGVGLGDSEWVQVYFSLEKLCKDVNPQSCRFFGKILGLQNNYYVAEIQYRDEEEYEEEEEENEDNEDEIAEEEEEGEDNEDALPKSSYKAPKPVPKETPGQQGANKYIYFVCTELGGDWVKLPHCTPSEIQASRGIKKYFTGDLDAEVDSFPVFPGKEINLLRAQIGRIAAGTVIAPFGFFSFDGEEEEEDYDEAENGPRYEALENPEFEGHPVTDLVDDRLRTWVHSRLHIAKQGRCIWFNPKGDNEDEEEEEEEEEDNERAESPVIPETGPELLTSLADDVEVMGLQPWSTRLASSATHENHNVAVVKSNLWPGATAVSDGKFFENIYIGWGVKFGFANSFSPVIVDEFCKEFVPEEIEIDDPTVEEETAFKENEMVGEGEEEEEEDYDDNE